MSKTSIGFLWARIGRVVSAVIVAYAVNAILVVATNQLFSPMAVDDKRHHYFLVIDFFSQCLYTIAAGYVGAVIAGTLQRRAMAILISLGLAVGTFSLVTSWNAEPHWYSISLLLVYAPCVSLGCKLRARFQLTATSCDGGSRRSNQDAGNGTSQISAS